MKKSDYQSKWFVDRWMAQIKFKKTDVNSHAFRSAVPYFDSWAEAHAYLLVCATTRLKKAKAELPAAKRSMEKVAGMKEPEACATQAP